MLFLPTVPCPIFCISNVGSFHVHRNAPANPATPINKLPAPTAKDVPSLLALLEDEGPLLVEDPFGVLTAPLSVVVVAPLPVTVVAGAETALETGALVVCPYTEASLQYVCWVVRAPGYRESLGHWL